MINTERFKSPQWIFIFYIIPTCLLVMIFRFILPGSEAPLMLFSREWRFLQGALEMFNLFPALAFSALVIPFGMVTHEENFQSFSEMFFKRLAVSVITAVAAAVILGLISFLALPMLKNHEENLRFKGRVYNDAKMHARERRDSGEWNEASQFIAICDNIWPENPDLDSLRVEIEINLSALRLRESSQRSSARSSLTREWRVEDASLSGDVPHNAVHALSMAEKALSERRYFDAHWLAGLAGRLAAERSPEVSRAAQLASEAWNMIASLAPNSLEERLYQIYNLKVSGYQAMDSKDFIRAYYIFQELLTLTPDDPDAKNFLAVSEQGAKETAFFIDEMQLSLGEVLTGALFSLPGSSGRAALRLDSLTTSADVSYGTGLNYMAFDLNSRPIAVVKSRFVKILPFTVNNNHYVMLLTHALDRDNEKGSYDSEWLIGTKVPGGILLNVNYEDFLLLSEVRRGIPNMQIDELYNAANKFENAGYVYQVFQAEILNRIGGVIFFLPMAILIIVLGWRYRVKKRPRYLFVIMLPILPVVFHGFVYLYRSVFNTLGIWLVLSMGFGAALTVYIFVLAAALFGSLIALAAQHA